jgi:hypothetical protein
VTYLMNGLGRCRRSVQRYLRLLEREGYIRTHVVVGARSRLCAGLMVELLAPLLARHHRKRWPPRNPGATQESQNDSGYRLYPQGARSLPVHDWAMRCMDGVFRSVMKTLPPMPGAS